MRGIAHVILVTFVVGIFAAAAAGIPSAVPVPGESPIETSGNVQSDLLIDCYAKFRGPNLDNKGIGPARISRLPDGHYVLRADFTDNDGVSGTVSRLVCWSGGFETQKDVHAPPLYPGGMLKADDATESAIAGWHARRNAAQDAAMTAKRLPPPDPKTVQLLEGIWLIDAKPDKGACLSHWYLQTQIEFEFRKSGGRALIFEPYDLFTAVQISGTEESEGTIVMQAQARDGGLHDLFHIRPLAPDRLEFLPVDASAKSQIAYRCGDAGSSVTGGVGLERLSTIAPPISGGTSLLAEVPGVSDEDLCRGKSVRQKGEPPHRSLQFELYGPAHYWLFGWYFGPEHKLGFDFVRSIEDRGEKGFILHMQEHLEKGDGWDVAESRGKLYDLTVIPHGDHVEIPELNTTFVRCKPGDLKGAGMQRL